MSSCRSPGDRVTTGIPALKGSIASPETAPGATTSAPRNVETAIVRPTRERLAPRARWIAASARPDVSPWYSPRVGDARARPASVRRSPSAARIPGQQTASPCVAGVVRRVRVANPGRYPAVPAARAKSVCARRIRAAAHNRGTWAARRCAERAAATARIPAGTGPVMRSRGRTVRIAPSIAGHARTDVTPRSDRAAEDAPAKSACARRILRAAMRPGVLNARPCAMTVGRPARVVGSPRRPGARVAVVRRASVKRTPHVVKSPGMPNARERARPVGPIAVGARCQRLRGATGARVRPVSALRFRDAARRHGLRFVSQPARSRAVKVVRIRRIPENTGCPSRRSAGG